MITIDPRFLDARTWTGQTGLLLARYGIIPKLTDERAWPQWAQYVVLLPSVAALSPPSPRGFENWRVWAVRFNQAISLLAD